MNEVVISQGQQFLAELIQETKATRALLSLVPLDKSDWKPHTKSMELGKLAVHVAEITGWAKEIILQDVLDFATMENKPFVPSTTDELLAFFDHRVTVANEILENVTDEELQKMWTMQAGPQKYFTLPKGVVLRTWLFSHLIHHRAQLGVYLRLLDIPLPSMYGPTADMQ